MAAITAEIERFNRLSTTWWNAAGPMRPLHVVNALRLSYVYDQISSHFALQPGQALSGLRLLDVGCGGGLMSEPLAEMGAHVVGVDASAGNVAAAQIHAANSGVAVDYRLGEPEHVLEPQEKFDVVLALEVVEHVSDMQVFLAHAASRVAPGGLLFASTIDRTWRSFIIAIVGAEYIARVLPRGTHEWKRFVRPSELRQATQAAGLIQHDLRGMRYMPVVHKASWCKSTAINYMATFKSTL